MKANHPADCMNCDASGRCEFQVGLLWAACGARRGGAGQAAPAAARLPLPSAVLACTAAQDLIARYNVKDVLPKLKAYSHEWDAEVQVRQRRAGGRRRAEQSWASAGSRLGGGLGGGARPSISMQQAHTQQRLAQPAYPPLPCSCCSGRRLLPRLVLHRPHPGPGEVHQVRALRDHVLPGAGHERAGHDQPQPRRAPGRGHRRRARPLQVHRVRAGGRSGVCISLGCVCVMMLGI